VTVQGLASTTVLDWVGDVYASATANGLVVIETTLLPPAASGTPPLIVVRVQDFATGRTTFRALWDTASALGGVVEGPRNWGGREAVTVTVAGAFVWVVGDLVLPERAR